MERIYNGTFEMDEQFFSDFDFSGRYTRNDIDMEKVNYSLLDQRFGFFKKKFPMLEDNIVALLAKTSLNEIENMKPPVTTPTEPIKEKPTKQKKAQKSQKPSLSINKTPTMVDFN